MKAEDIDTCTTGQFIKEVEGSSGNFYKLYRTDKNKVVCDCPAYKMCKHIKDYLFRERLERKLTELDYRGFISFDGIEGRFDSVVNVVCKLREEWK